MNARHDPELEDVLQDEEMRRIGDLLGSTRRLAPPLDDAFRSGLRRQLMQQAWDMGEGRPSLWRRVFAPPGLAWVGATAGLVLIAGLVVFYTTQQPGGSSRRAPPHLGFGRGAAPSTAHRAGAQVSGGHEDRGHRGRDGQVARRREAPHPSRRQPAS